MAIDKEKLINEITLYDRDNQPEIIRFVRVESKTNEVVVQGTTFTTNHLIFVDVENSEYSDLNKFAVGRVVKIDGHEMTIRQIARQQGATALHHLEVLA